MNQGDKILLYVVNCCFALVLISMYSTLNK